MNKFNLRDHKKIKAGFSAPDDYFLSLEERLLLQKSRKIPLYKNHLTLIAASLVGICLAVVLSSDQQEMPDPESIETYLLSYAQINEADLANELAAEQINALGSQLEVSLEDIDDVDQEIIIEEITK